MSKKVLLVRSYVAVGTVGPIPPLELLYTATQIKAYLPDYICKILDTGIEDKTMEDVKKEMQEFSFDIICLNAYAWEARLVHKLACVAKSINQRTVCIVLGQLASLAKANLLLDKNIDYVVVGEPEITVRELLVALNNQDSPRGVNGLIYKEGSETITTQSRLYPQNIDDISIALSSWDLIDVKKYAKYANWNGALKEDFFIPILTSRGCPFPCKFCRETYDRKFLARTPANVVSEIKVLHDKYGAKEFHIYDSVFNYDEKRAKEICRLIIDSGLKISLSFPHGIRADIMTDELIDLLRKAGTYKLVYGIETGSARIQKMIHKNLNLNKIKEVIKKTAKTGILVGGYFMLGHETETEEEMEQTIDYAVNSDLDIASFFKAMDYDDLNKIYEAKAIGNQDFDAGVTMPYSFEDLGYYSVKRCGSHVSSELLNHMVLKAQRKFYLNIKRVLRGIIRYPRKHIYIRNLIYAFGVIAQAYIMEIFKKELGHGETKIETAVQG